MLLTDFTRCGVTNCQDKGKVCGARFGQYWAISHLRNCALKGNIKAARQSIQSKKNATSHKVASRTPVLEALASRAVLIINDCQFFRTLM